jgi:hypothetical protein
MKNGSWAKLLFFVRSLYEFSTSNRSSSSIQWHTSTHYNLHEFTVMHLHFNNAHATNSCRFPQRNRLIVESFLLTSRSETAAARELAGETQIHFL